MKLNRVEQVYAQADPRFAAFETVAYSRARGAEMIRFRWSGESSPGAAAVSLAFSTDNGRAWEPGPGPGGESGVSPVAVGPRLVLVGGAGPGALRCRLSEDGGRTWAVDEPVAPEGADASLSFSPSNTPLALKDGRVLVPCTVAEAGDSGCAAAGVLEGRWQGDGRLTWKRLPPVRIKPGQSQGGVREPALAEMPDGRILMVMAAGAGAADPNAGYKWFSVSSDGGRSWGRPWPWTFSDGSPFYSPGSASRLFRHSSGEWYWIGIICPDAPREDRPGYPLVIGRVDPASLRLEMETLDVIDTRREGDTDQLDLSHFSLYEDRQTADVVLRLTRRDGAAGGGGPVQAPVMAYTFDL
jgi:hypothetical protein